MKHPRTHVSDHAVLRYLERVAGFDIEALRREIGRKVDRAAVAGASGVVIDGMVYKLVGALPDCTVVTVRKAHGPDICTGRRGRGRGGSP